MCIRSGRIILIIKVRVSSYGVAKVMRVVVEVEVGVGVMRVVGQVAIIIRILNRQISL